MNWRLAILLIYLSGLHSYRLGAQYWSTLGGGFGYGGGGVSPVYALVEHNNELYAGGYFGIADMIQANCIAKWDGDRWNPLGPGLNGTVYAMVVYNGELYAGGLFSFTSFSTVSVARWNGSTWSAVGTGFSSASWNEIRALAVYNGDLYAGGSFKTADGVLVNNIAKWNGSNWLPVGAGTNNDVRALVVHNGALYAGGSFDTAGGFPAFHIAKWDGTAWSSLGTGTNGPVNALVIYRDTLQVAGVFSQAGGNPANNIAKWDGRTWNPLRSGLTGSWGGSVMALAIYNDYLYAGGDINLAAGNPVNNIAKWNGDSWSSVRQGANFTVQALLSADSSLYAGGWFDRVDGGLPASNIAKWKENCSNPPPVQPGAINGNWLVCPGSTENYQVNPVPNATNYSWTLWQGWQGASTTNTIAVSIPPGSAPFGSYFPISVIAQNDCGGSYFTVADISLYEEYDSGIEITGFDQVCGGDTVTYHYPLPGSNYSWTLPTGWTGSSDSSYINVIAGPQSGTLVLDLTYHCGYTLQQSLDITTFNPPAQPGPISGNGQVTAGQTQNYSVNPVPGVTGYIWSLPSGGIITTGNNTNSITVNFTTAGVHQLSVKSYNLCGQSSVQTIQVTVSVLTPVTTMTNNSEVYITPNPSSGPFYLRVKGMQSRFINTEILNSVGQLIFSSREKAGSNDYSQLINIPNMAQGIYWLRILIDNKVFLRSFARIE
ncbi:MAG TPA: T9SS type A sorting domain-containing protein [Chitinophagaceae bacterium]|nr:T9SS type A sorting domain-containing protein [Chitinophagaceae bacterium]